MGAKEHRRELAGCCGDLRKLGLGAVEFGAVWFLDVTALSIAVGDLVMGWKRVVAAVYIRR